MKLVFFVTLCACLVYYQGAMPYSPPLDGLGEGEYCIYSTERVYSDLITKRVDTGFSYMYFCDSADAGALRAKFSKIDGESIAIPDWAGGAGVAEVVGRLRYRVVLCSGLGEVVYAYSPRDKGYIVFDGKKVNLQVSLRGDTVVVGWPVILGSY